MHGGNRAATTAPLAAAAVPTAILVHAGASSVFEEILAADCQREAGTRTAQVAADGHILDLLVQFMYGKTVHVPVIDVMTVYQLTQQYGMCTAGHKLSNIIRHEIEGFDPQALCHILHQAYQLGDMAKQIVEQAVADFRRRMFDFGANYFTSIADFQQWPIGLLSLVLEEHPGRDIYYRRYSRVGMIRVTYAVSAAAWVNTATDNRMEHWEELLQQVKLDQLESREIQNIKDIYPNLLQMPGVEEAMQEAANLCSRCCK